VHCEEHCNVYPSPNIIRVMNPMMMRWAECEREVGNSYRILIGEHEYVGVDE
jgi:hypothetical protein